MPFCAHCYAAATTRAASCGTCNGDRSYCSAECRTSDWNLGHKQWCGRSCEPGVGYAIRDAGPGKGFGVFALRDFEAGDKVMVEASSLRAPRDSPVALAELRALSPSVCTSIMGMSPYAADGEEEMGEAAVLAALQLKFTNNAMDLNDGKHTSALFNTIGRVNHDCVGNCEHEP